MSTSKGIVEKIENNAPFGKYERIKKLRTERKLSIYNNNKILLVMFMYPFF